MIDGPGGPLIGITEGNVNLLTPGDVPSGFEQARDDVGAMRPQLYRMMVDWSFMQPDPAQPAQLGYDIDGCMRAIKPCGRFQAFKDTLKAIAARQKQGPGWNVVVTIYGVPPWAANSPRGCERDNLQPRSRAINEAGLDAYKKLIKQIAGAGDAAGAELRFWSPWNEPNQVFFISPQREKCDTDSPLVSPPVYAKIFEAAHDALDDLDGERDIILGDLAGSPKKGKRAGKAGEFLQGLPDEVICDADAIALHSYPGNDFDVVEEATRETDSRGCDEPLPVWITETGSGDKRAGKERDDSRSAVVEQCERYDGELRAWSKNPRVKVAVQYTVREDPQFRVGLVDAPLEREYPSFDLLRKWSRVTPGQPPPAGGICG